MAEDESERSPFTRPAFLVAAVVVILIVVVGIVVVVVNLNHHDPSPSTVPSSSASAAPTTKPSEVAGGASVCGLHGKVLTGTLSTAPDATWKYDGTIAYPTSSEYGPAKTSNDGVRYCFQHSPEGALFASANALVAASSTTAQQAWLNYFLADGPHKQSILDSLASGSSSSTSGTRLNIAGFRVLSYDGSAATVDVAVEGSTDQGSITGSFVYDLVWQAGDWKLSADTAQPFSFAVIPDLAGYIQWRS